MVKQFLSIVFGFVLGQGTMFIVQTYLLINNKIEIIANIGIGLGILSLVQWMSDGGGIFQLSRMIDDGKLQKNIFSLFLGRLIMGSGLFLIIYSLVLYFYENNNVVQIIKLGWVVVILWSFNLVGILDYYSKNHMYGPFSGINWMLPAIYVYFYSEEPNLYIGVSVSYLIGIFLMLAIQFVLIKPKFLIKISMKIDRKTIKSAFDYNLAFLISQGYARIVPIIIDKNININTSGVYVYAKNICNLISQLCQFIRRLEFKILVEQFKKENSSSKIMYLQKKTLLFVLISTCSVILISGIGYKDVIGKDDVLLYMMLLLLIPWVIASNYSQYFISIGALKIYSRVMCYSVIISLITINYFIMYIGVYSIIVAEVLMYLFQIYIYRKKIRT